MHEPLDLKALDHLERRMPRLQGHVWITQEYVDYIGDSLRPLLDLVENMGEALDRVREDDLPMRPLTIGLLVDALDDYRRAKGGEVMMIKMRELLDEVRRERVYQKETWGDDHDQGHELSDWMRFIDQRLHKLNKQDGILTPPRRRRYFVQIAALAIAAIEALEARDE